MIFFSADNGRIEALQMPDLQDAACARRPYPPAPCGSNVGRDRLFHQHVDAGFQQRAADFGMGGSRDRDHGSIDLAGQIVERRVRLGIRTAPRQRPLAAASMSTTPASSAAGDWLRIRR